MENVWEGQHHQSNDSPAMESDLETDEENKCFAVEWMAGDAVDIDWEETLQEYGLTFLVSRQAVRCLQGPLARQVR